MLLNYERTEDEILTDEKRHIVTLMHHLKEWMEELHDYELIDTGNGFFNDILGVGLQEIDFYELAKSYYEDYVSYHGNRG